MNEYDKRQIDLMRERIRFYHSQNLKLGSLISDLESLCGYLQEINDSWKSEFISLCGRLEEIYGCALEYDQGVLRDEDMVEIEKILSNLESMFCENSTRIEDNT